MTDGLNIWKLILEVAVAVLTICGIILGWFRKLVEFVRARFTRRPKGLIDIPKKSLVLIAGQKEYSCSWQEGEIEGNAAMLMHGTIVATNISEYSVRAVSLKVGAKIRHPMICTKDQESNMFGQFMIPSRSMSEISFNFWISPPTKRKGQSFKTKVCIIDQFGNEHWLKNLEFKSL